MELIQPKIYVTDFEVEQCLAIAERLDEIVQLYGPEQPIVIHIESPGGCAKGLFILLDALNSVPNPVYTYSTGLAASAGFVLLVAGNRNGGHRIVGENADLMLHGTQLGVRGVLDLNDMEEIVRSTRVYNDRVLNIVARAIGLDSIEALEELVRSKTKSHDLNLTAQEAKDLKMIDVIGALKLVPPTPQFGLMIFDSDIEGHRAKCTDKDCECREEHEVSPEVSKEVPSKPKKVKKNTKKIKKKKKIAKMPENHWD